GAVGDEVHHHHERGEVEEEAPLGGDAPAEMAPALRLALLPDRGLLDPEADEEGEEGGQAADVEHGPPAPAREHEEVAAGGQQIAHRVTRLNESGAHAPPAP